VISRLARHPADWRWSSYRAWAGSGRVPVPVDPLRGAADRTRSVISGPLNG